MQVNSVSTKYYEETQIYLQKMRDKAVLDRQIEHEQHLQQQQIERTQRARELDKTLGQNIDITV